MLLVIWVASAVTRVWHRVGCAVANGVSRSVPLPSHGPLNSVSLVCAPAGVSAIHAATAAATTALADGLRIRAGIFLSATKKQ